MLEHLQQILIVQRQRIWPHGGKPCPQWCRNQFALIFKMNKKGILCRENTEFEELQKL